MSTVTTYAPGSKVRYGYAKGPAQVAALVVALLLVVIGVLGFIPGITTGLGSITFAGPWSGAHIFDIFQTSVLRNVVWIFFGLAGLAAPKVRLGSTLYITAMAGLSFTLWFYGLLFGERGFPGNIFSSNLSDFGLDFSLGLAFAITALATSQLALMGSDYEE
jgi:flagellar biosynthesis protein FliQ